MRGRSRVAWVVWEVHPLPMTEQTPTVPDQPNTPETEPAAAPPNSGKPDAAPADTDKSAAGRRRSLSRKLMAAVLILGFAAIMVLGWIAVTASGSALLEQQSSSLEALRVSRAHFVEGYFGLVRDQLANFAGRRSVIEAMEDFTAAYATLPSQDRRPTDEGSEVYRAVVDYYVDEFRPRAEGAGFEWQRREYYIPMSATGRLLQATYVAGNPHPVGEKEELMSAGLDTDYDRVHADVHPLAHNFLHSFGYYDIFLFDLYGDLVYSVTKEADFGTNFVGGPYQNSNLAVLYHRLRGTAQQGEILFEDFAPYEPSYGAPAAFIGTPVFRGDEKIGVVIFQLPVDEVNRIMTETAGLGETGETFLVGPDGLMRSASRFQDASSILSVRVETEAATLALAGESGTIVNPDYRGVDVLVSYGPLDVQGVPWAIMAKFDMAEVVAPATALRTRLLIFGAGLAAFFAVAASLFLARVVVRPVRKLVDGARDLESGDYSRRVEIASNDEIGELAGAFNHMAESIESDISAREEFKKELQSHNDALEHELRVARELIDEAKARVDGPLLGDSVAVRGLREAVERLAASNDTLLLTGPPGAGQEAIARTIHGQSERNGRAFIYVNCATLHTSPGLKLIGSAAHNESGSPAGGPVGKLELADGGTLYLDSINALPPDAQEQLAEQLAELEARRRAGETPRPDVRVIAYTPKDLGEHTTGGRFSAALFKHLVKQQLHVPSLLERQDDIPVLVNYFAREHTQRMGKPLEGVSEESMERLQGYRWPGNINELKNLLERVVVASTGPVLEVDESLLEEGIELDRYRLVEKLGEGGMGEVWLARHQMLARPAAVKLVRSEVFSSGPESEAAVQRFQREAKAIANLQSPHTVELYDFGVSENGAFYYVMELLNGLDLSSMVEKFGPMPAERVVMLLRQACRSLTEAHDAGLVHRDIKPANLFVCKLGPECDFLKVLDFGIVKAVADADKTAMTALTQAGQFTGTPAYTSPEQALEGGNVGPQTDLYALGCVAYWMLTGRTVFEADSPMQVLVHHTQTEPTAPSRMTEQPVPEALDAVLLACLRKNPAERPQSANEVWRMLGEVGFVHPWTQERAEEWWQLHGPEMARAAVTR